MKAIRVLHVLGAMNQGGIETWLMHVLRHLDRKAFITDLLVHTNAPAAYDNEVLALGSRILRCPYAGNPLYYAGRFLQLVRANGPFDVLHSHVHQFSGFVLALGRAAGIPVRIAHSHNDTSELNSRANLIRAAYLAASRYLIDANSTHGLAVSRPAAAALFGADWQRDTRFQVLYCGIDPAAFDRPISPASVRAEFGFSCQDIVFGHVGRFSPQKNHRFLLEIASEIRKLQAHAKFLLVGDGPLRPEMEVLTRALGLQDCTVYTGGRSDIPRLMMSGMDLHLLPSLHEGLPLVLLEAQAAGLTSLVSEGIPQEAVIHPALVRRLPLSMAADGWARVACAAAKEPRFNLSRAISVLESSPFEIDRCVQRLSSLYRDAVPSTLLRGQEGSIPVT